MKRRRNPSQEQISHYGKRLPYIVAALDKAMRYADGVLGLPPSWDVIGTMPSRADSPEWIPARRIILIKLAMGLVRTAWINKSMEKNKKSPYTGTVVDWYINRSINMPEDVGKVQETLREFHEGIQSGLIKGDAAKIENYHTQQDLAQYLKQLKGFLLKGGGYESIGCVRVAELGKYVLFRIDDHKTGEEAFRDTNWCVRAPDQFKSYGPPYFMVINTKVAEGHDDRVCLMHNNSKQIKDVDDRRLSRVLQKELKPFMESVFGRWACKYNMTDGDDGDLDVGDQWWPLSATTPFDAVGEILDILWTVGGKLVEISEGISTSTQDYFYDDALKRYKKEHDDDADEDDGFEEWFEKWRDSPQGNKELSSLEDGAIHDCDVLTRKAFDMFDGMLFDPECGMDQITPKIFQTSWDKMKKRLNIRQNKQEKVNRNGSKYTVITGHTIGGNPRFNRNHATPKMEAWAERSIDRFLDLLPDERDFGRYMNRRDSSVWSSLPGAMRLR